MRYVSAVVAFVVVTAHSYANAAVPSVECGGFPLPYYTTIGWSGPSKTDLRPSSVIAVAAVVAAGSSDNRARAWVVWDERGKAWIGVKKDSPADLIRAFFPEPPNFDGRGARVHFALLGSELPNLYRLEACPGAVP